MPLSDIKGQDRVIESIKRGFSSERLAHAYIFSGLPGTGRHKAAIEFAKFLSCGLDLDDNCGVCHSCLMVERKSHPDIFFIEREEGKKSIPIESIRRLKARFSLKPVTGKFNIAVIDAQDLTEEASNSILKILEEPLAQTVFILIAEPERSLPDTIVSRCQIMRFKPLNQDNAPEKTPGDKLDLAWKNSVIDNFLKNFNSDLSQDIPGITPKLDNERLCDILMGFYRDILVYKHTGENRLLINLDRLDDIVSLSRQEDSKTIQVKMGYIDQAKSAFRVNANAKLTLGLLRERLENIQA